MYKVVVLIILGFLLLSCTDDNETGDLFSIDVVDAEGNPVSGLSVSINNIFSNGQIGGRPMVNIPMLIDHTSHIKLEIYNLQNELVRNLCDDDLEAGTYHFSWNGHNTESELANIGGTNIFRYEMTASDSETGDVLYNDSKYMCMELLLETDLSVVGSTNEVGAFYCNNKLAFSHLFNLGEQPKLDESAFYCGTFTLSDSINIKLCDPETEEYLIYTVEMGSSSHNHYNLVWENPQTESYKAGNPVIDSYLAGSERGVDDEELPTGFELRQNYPNPFN